MNYLVGLSATIYVWVDVSPYLPDGGSHQKQDFKFAENLVEYGVLRTQRAFATAWLSFPCAHSQSRGAVPVGEGLKQLLVTPQ